MTLTVTRHAIDRYRERVADLPDVEIVSVLSGPPFRLAAEVGAPFVKLSTGQRAVVSNSAVVTVLPADCHLSQLRRHRKRGSVGQ